MKTSVYFNILNVIDSGHEDVVIDIIKRVLKRYNMPYTEILISRPFQQLDIKFEVLTIDVNEITEICKRIYSPK